MSNKILNISLLEILKKYFNYSDSDFEKQGKNIYLTKCPLHDEKKGSSLALYDKTSKGEGWDWTCFGACSTGGTAPKLLTDGNIFPSIEEAVADLSKKFGITPPDIMNLENFAENKGLDLDFLKSRGLQTFEDNSVTIPFYNFEKEIVSIKKRLKFTGKPKYIFLKGENELYGLDLVPQFSDDIIFFTEGETDCLTALQSNLPANGIPGASGWKSEWKKHFSKFKKVVVLSDQDAAGIELIKTLSLDFPNNLYIGKFNKKFNDINDFFMYGCNGSKDTFFKHFMNQTHIPATPETFRESIIQNSEMLSSMDAWNVLFKTLNNDEVKILLFVDSLKSDDRVKIGAKIIQSAYKTANAKLRQSAKSKDAEEETIYIKDKCYYKAMFTSDGGAIQVRLSNFIIHLLHTVESEGNHIRICKLENSENKMSRIVRFDSDTLTKPIEFMAECKKAGNYVFRGDFKDLIDLNEIILKQEVDTVLSPDHIGRISDSWLMGTYGIDKHGDIKDSNEDGIIELDDSKFMVRNINILNPDDEIYYPIRPDTELAEDYLPKLAQTLKQNIGDYRAWMALGFTIAGWHSDEIFKLGGDKSFPILFIAGKRNSGKTVLARWLMSSYGFSHLEGKNFSTPTVVSIARKAGYYSSLPMWYDDYRNNIKDIKYRNEFLLGMYNRQGADKGTRSGFGVRAERIRSVLLLSGEDTPDDNAVLSRCVVVNVSSYDRDDTLLPDILELVRHFPAMGYHFLRNKQLNGSTKLLAKIIEIQEILMHKGIDARLARNKAVFAGSFLSEFGKFLTDTEQDDFISWLCIETTQTKIETEQDHTVSRFISDIHVLMSNDKLLSNHHYKIEDGHVYLWFKSCYDVWAKEYQPDIKRTVLLNYLKKEPYCDPEPVGKRFKHGLVKSIRIDYEATNDDDFKNFCQSQDESVQEF